MAKRFALCAHSPSPPLNVRGHLSHPRPPSGHPQPPLGHPRQPCLEDSDPYLLRNALKSVDPTWAPLLRGFLRGYEGNTLTHY